MYEMLCGKLPFAIRRGAKMSIKIYDQGVNYPVNMNSDAKDFIQKLLVVDPNQRLGSGPNGTQEIKNHNFFNGINWNDAKMRKIRPPFIPKLKSDTDLRYFDTMFTDEPIDENQRSNINKDRSREASNEYIGFSYITNSVANELNSLALMGGGNDE